MSGTPIRVANWISTVGWFTVNIILGGYALELAFGLPFFVAAGVMVVVDVALATYGHDIIHTFEKVMSVVLGVMFGAMTVLAYFKMGANFSAYQASASFDSYYWALVVAVVFSYLMSWSPYASDYSRYLPRTTSRWKLVAFTTAGGAIVERLGGAGGLPRVRRGQQHPPQHDRSAPEGLGGIRRLHPPRHRPRSYRGGRLQPLHELALRPRALQEGRPGPDRAVRRRGRIRARARGVGKFWRVLPELLAHPGLLDNPVDRRDGRGLFREEGSRLVSRARPPFLKSGLGAYIVGLGGLRARS